MAKVKYASKTKRFFKGKGFYLVACACMIAVGAAAFSAISQLPQPPIDEGDGTQSVYSAAESLPSALETPVDAVVSNQPDDRPQQDVTSAESASSTPAAAPVATFFVPPVVGEVIKPFSATELQYSETFCDMRLHLGIDIAAEAGTAVTAAGEGTVTAVEQDPLWGTYIVVDHGNGVVIKYCALAETPTVKKGDTVTGKTQIGVLAAIPCESVERSHLHVEVLKDEEPIDPLTLLGV